MHSLGDLMLEVDATDADDVDLVGRIIQSSVQRSVVADGRDHDHFVGGQLPHLKQYFFLQNFLSADCLT